MLAFTNSWGQCPGLGTFSSPLVASSPTSTTVGLSWGVVSGRSFYQVKYRVLGGSNFIQFGPNITSTSLTVSSLAPGTSYEFFIEAFKTCLDGEGNPAESSVTSNLVGVIMVPATPTGLSVVSTSITSGSFTATWNTTLGASSYSLDVSPNAGFTPVTNYVVNQPNTQITINSGILPGTQYYLRIKAVNSSGSSGFSNITVVTILDPPTVTIPTSTVTSNSITLNWGSVPGSTGYRIDISTSSTFEAGQFVGDNENKLVTGTTLEVSGLSPEVTYYARMRAEKDSPSPFVTSLNSMIISRITRTLPPLTLSTSSIKSNSFTIVWEELSTATNYQLDVATDNLFTNKLTNYNNVSFSSNSTEVSGLSPGTIYYWQVRAVNSTGPSLSSVPVEVLTAPAIPLVFDKSNITSNGFTVNWTSVPTVTEYDLFIYRDQNFTDAVEGFNPLVVIHPTVTADITGLSPSTTYFLRLRARNAPDLPSSGSGFITISATTPAIGGSGSSTPSFKNLAFPDFFIPGETKEISNTVTGGVGALEVSLYHRPSSQGSYSKDAVSLANGIYKVTLNDSWFDQFGMEFYFEVTDANQTQRDLAHTILTGQSEVAIPLTSFGKQLKNYQIISVPYLLDDNHINNAFEKIMGAYNKKKWRLSQYNNDRLIDYENGLSANLIAQGQGYWFISRDEVSLMFGKGNSFGNSITTPFKLQLRKGWNQIGNPFPYDLSWQDVMNANASPATVSTLYTFNPENVSFIESDLLQVYGGGFVFADEATELIFPVTLPKKTNGRKKSGLAIEDDNESNWSLPIILTQGEVTNELSGIGMHVDAQDGKDKFDKITPPKFIRYVEFNSHVPTFPYELSNNIIAPKEAYAWHFLVESNSDELVTLTWNQSLVAQMEKSLLLYDEAQQQLVNMADIGSHQTTPRSKITIYYENKSTRTESGVISIGKPFPNPFVDEITIPLGYSIDEPIDVTLSITDITGRVIWREQSKLADAGLQQIKWDGRTIEGKLAQPGLYLYKAYGRKNGVDFSINGKLIKNE